MMALAAPSYTVPTRPTVRARVEKRYADERSNLISRFEKATSVSLTTDTWTSNSTESFITVTAHYLDAEWILHSDVLMTRAMPERHTAENIAEFGLTGKVECCVHDNARNIQKAGTLCPEWGDHSCFAHTLQLCIKPVLELPSVSKPCNNDTALVASMKTTLRDEMTERFQPGRDETAESLPMIASLLDPRYKKLSFLPRQLRRRTHTMLEGRLDDVPLKVSSRDDGDCATPAKRPRLEFMVTSPESSMEDDLQLYLAEKMDDAIPALELWRRNENRFPKVAHVARSVLAVPATSVPSE
ncbi:ZBED1-like protein, partial [Mya arenaria]